MNENNTFKGFETWFNNVRMALKMHMYIIIIDLAVCLLIASSIVYYRHGDDLIILADHLILSLLLWKFANVYDVLVLVKKIFWANRLFYAAAPILVGIPFYAFILWYFGKRSAKQQSDEYISGSQLIPVSKIEKKLRKIDTAIPLGELTIPVADETKHFFVVGRTGSGKTQVMKRALTHLQAQGAKIICYDNKGDYLPSNYDPDRDIIFNPTDSRSVAWSLMNDAMDTLDIDQVICHSFFPDSVSRDPFWEDAAREVLRSVLYYVLRSSRGQKIKNKQIWDTLQSGAANIGTILRTIPEGKIGLQMISEATSKQTQGIMANLLKDVAILELMARQDGDFSVRAWLHDPTPGTLYVVNHSKSKDILKPILTLLIDVAAHEILSMPDDHNRRIYIFLDEFGSLNPMNSIIELLTRARSKGASVWLGTQEIGQIEKLYGRELRAAIINGCATKVILSVAEPDTATYLSDMIGETEIRSANETQSMGPANLRDGLSFSKNIRTKKLLLPSDLQSLRDLEAIVKLANYSYARTYIPFIKYFACHQYFLIRNDMRLSAFSAALREYNDGLPTNKISHEF
ncbi:MAG: type IV secretion system DNA-binding domain-containing protein [Deltaproteobacteria bacterium]|nr:type IV secretion system DNA-binding domain-containing protein [Deltaproteobacteria bacterium]